MSNTIHLDNYKILLQNLKTMVQTTEQRILNSDDEFFSSNSNFFTKSFIVIMSAYLESYIKDVLMLIIDEMNARLDKNKVPYNLIKWASSSDSDKRELAKNTSKLEFKNFKLSINKKELDDFISGNPHRTESLFSNFGINLRDNENFKIHKERLNFIIGKRNAIIHHNDIASDISPKDIIEHLDLFIKYIENIDSLVVNHIEQS